MRILGIDPGYGTCGWGVISDNGNGLEMVAGGVVKTPPNLPFPQRLTGLKAAITKLIHDFRPTYLGIEKPVHGPNVTNSVEVGAAFGAVLLAAEEMAVPILIYWPSEVKAAVLKGNAKKKEVQQQVALILGLPKIPRPDDAADALAVAICTINRCAIDTLEQAA